MKTICFVLAAVTLAAGAARAQSLEEAAAPPPTLSSTPPAASVFAKVHPVPRTYMGNAAEPVWPGMQDRSAFGVYVADPKLFAGVRLSPNVAVEAGYANLFTRGYHFADYARPDEVAGALGTKGTNSYLAGRIDVPVTDSLSTYGKLGIAYSERTARDQTLRTTKTDSDVGAYAGMGATYKVSEKASVSAQYEQYGNTGKKWGSETNNSGVSAKFRMGF